MPVEKKRSYTYFSVSKKGEIRCTSKGEMHDEVFGSIWGILTGIELKEDSWEGEKIFKWQFKLEAPDHSGVDILQIGESSSGARGIFLSLMSIEGPIKQIKFSPYLSKAEGSDKSYTNIWVEHRNFEDDPWEEVGEWPDYLTDNMPEPKMVKVGNREVVDDWERVKYIRGLASRIKKTKINTNAEQLEKETKPDPVQQTTVEVHDEERSNINMDDIDNDLPF